MTDLRLTALVGTNPLGLFAALGTLDGVNRVHPEWGVKLSWSNELLPRAILHNVPYDNLDDVLQALDTDRIAWQSSTLLNWGPNGQPIKDIKISCEDARSWLNEVMSLKGERKIDEQFLISALFAEDTVDRKGNIKPTHFHFTAGNQLFLKMVRQLATEVDCERLQEAVIGPWKYDSKLPVLGWDSNRGERIYAMRANNPAGDQKLGVPGADWLGFVGLSYFPVWPYKGKLFTTGCSQKWKGGNFTWPLWDCPLSPSVIRSLLRDASLSQLSLEKRRAMGISNVLRSPIIRNESGGYGSFGSPEAVLGSKHFPQRSDRLLKAMSTEI